jgi:hypothetical protein
MCGTTCTCRKGYRVLYRQRHENGNTEGGEIRYVAKDQVGKNCDGSGPGGETEKEKGRKRKKKEKRVREDKGGRRGERDGGPTRDDMMEEYFGQVGEQLANLQDQVGGLAAAGGMGQPTQNMGMRAGPGGPRGPDPYDGAYAEMMDPRLSNFQTNPQKPRRGMGGRFGPMGGRPEGPGYGPMSEVGDEYGSDMGLNGLMGGMEAAPHGARGGGRRGRGPPNMSNMRTEFPPPDLRARPDHRAAFMRPEHRFTDDGTRGATGMEMPRGMPGLEDLSSPYPFNQPKSGGRGGKKRKPKPPKDPQNAFPFPPLDRAMKAHMTGGARPTEIPEGPDPEADWEDFNGT